MDVFEVLSEKGKAMLVMGGYKFTFHKNLVNSKRWKCTRRNCKAYLKTDSDKNTVIVESMVEHNHQPDSQEGINRQVLSNLAKKMATDNLSEKPIKVIRQVIKSNGLSESVTTKDVLRTRKNLYHARSVVLPKLPKDIMEFHNLLGKLDIVTDRQEQFLMINDSVNNIVIFSCKTNLQCLVNSEELYADGSFEYS